MKLAIRTSSGPYGVALFSGDAQLVASRQAEGVAKRSRNLGALYSDMLNDTGPITQQLTEIRVDLGPGGLSSTRVGVSFANALAFGTSAKLTGVSALELQYHEARRSTDLPILSMRPAPGRRVFWSLFDKGVPLALGCDKSQDVVRKLADDGHAFALAGPLPRLGFDDPSSLDRPAIEIDPPCFESFLDAKPHAAISHAGLYLLEPITDVEGLVA